MEPRPLPNRRLFLSPKEVAPMVGASEDWVREAIRVGSLPGRKVMGRYKVNAAVLEEFLRDQPRDEAVSVRRPWS